MAALLAVAFFLPWVGMGPFSLSGYGITRMGSEMGGVQPVNFIHNPGSGLHFNGHEFSE